MVHTSLLVRRHHHLNALAHCSLHGSCRVSTARNSPSYQPLSPRSGLSPIASCHPANLLAFPALTTRRMLCLNQLPLRNGHLEPTCQVALLTACLLLSQEDAHQGTLQAVWPGSLLPIYQGSNHRTSYSYKRLACCTHLYPGWRLFALLLLKQHCIRLTGTDHNTSIGMSSLTPVPLTLIIACKPNWGVQWGI